MTLVPWSLFSKSSRRLDQAPERLDAALVALFGRADVIVVTDVQLFPEIAEVLAVLVGEGERVQPMMQPSPN